MQVIERHLVCDLHTIFSPITVNNLSDQDILQMASEPPLIRRQREFLRDRLEKLKKGQEIFYEVMGRV
jgi:hypothetical protein